MSARGKLNPLAGSFVPAQPFGNSPSATQANNNNNNGPTQRTPQPQQANPFSSSGTPPPPATTTLTNQNQQKQVEDTRASLHKLLHHARLGVLQLLPQADHLPFERVLHRSFHVAHTQGKLSITSESVTGGGGASSRGGSAAAVSSPSSGGTESLFPVVQFPPPFWRYFNLTQLRSIAQLIAEIELGAAGGPPSSSSSPSSPSSAASSPSSPSCLHKADVELLKGIYIRSVSPLLPLETRKRLAAMGVEGPTTAAATTTPDKGATESASPAEGGSATAVPTTTPTPPVSGAFTDADLENVVSFIIDIYYLFFRMSFLPAVEEGGVAAYSAYVQHITQVRSYLLDVSQLYGKPFLRMVLPLMVVSRYYVSRLRQSGEASSPTAQVRLAFSANFIRLMTMFFSLCPGESAERAKDKIPAEYVPETQLILLTTTTEALAVFPALTSEEQKRGGSSMSGSDLFGTPTGSSSSNNNHHNNNHHASVDWPYRRYTVAPWGYHIPSQASGGVRVEGSAVLSPASAASPLFPEIRSLPSWIESVLPTRRLPPRLHGTSFELRAVPHDGGDRECTSVMDDAVHGWDDFQQQQQQQHQTPPNRTRSVDYGRATPPKPYVGAGTTTTTLSTESHQRLHHHHQQHPLGEGDAGGGPLHRHDGELDNEENDDDNLFRSESAFVGQCNDALSWFDEDQTVLFATLTLAHTDLVPTTTLVQILDALLGAYQNREGASFEPLLRLMMMLKGNDGADLLLGGGVPTLSDRLEEEEQTHSDETQAPADRLNSGESADGLQYRAHTSPPPVHLESTGNPFSIGGGRRGSAATEEEEAEDDLLTDSEGYDSSSEGPLPQAFQEILDLLMQTIKAGKPQHLLALQAAHSIVQRRFEDEAKARRNNNMAPASLHTSPAVGPAMHGLIGGGTSVGSTQSIGQHWNALRQPETPKRTPHGGGSSRLLDDGGNGDEDDDDGEFGGGGGGGPRPTTEQLYRDDNSFRGTPGPGGIGGQTSFGMWPGVDDADASLVEVTQIGGTSVSSTNGLFQGNGSIW